MSLFRFNTLRQFIRRHTKPMDEYHAATWKKRLSFAYIFLAWNAFGFVVYMIWNGKADWAKELKTKEELALTPAQQWSKTLGIKNATVYRISGFNVTSYEIHNDLEQKKPTDKGQEELTT